MIYTIYKSKINLNKNDNTNDSIAKRQERYNNIVINN